MDALLFLRQGLLFLHLVAFAFAVAEVLRGDWQLLRARSLDVAGLHRTASVVSLALAALWITGLGLVALDTGFDPAAIAAKPKLVTKFIVVTALTINGVLLHRFAFPMLGGAAARSVAGSALIASLGAISSVSWIYAAFVGSARLIAGIMSLEAFLALYGIGLAGGVAVAVLVVAPLLRRRLDARAPRTLMPLDDEAKWRGDTDVAVDGRPADPVPVETRRRA